MKRIIRRARSWQSTTPANRRISVGIGIVLVGIASLALYQYFFEARRTAIIHVLNQIVEVSAILEKIDASCGITGFELDKNYLTFFNVKAFVGAAVGSMRLKHPEKWAGPYTEENPTIQDKYYYVLKTAKNEYYLIPGDGVVLSDGKILGKDIMIDPETDIQALLKKEPALWVKEQPLIVPIKLRQMPLSPAQKIRLLGASELE